MLPKKTTASQPFFSIVLRLLIGLGRQQPRVSFLHCEELRALTNSKKASFMAFFFFFGKFIFGFFQAELFGPWEGGGGRGRKGGEGVRPHSSQTKYRNLNSAPFGPSSKGITTYFLKTFVVQCASCWSRLFQ